MKAMARQRSHSIEFKRQVAQEFIAGESLYALSKRHDISRQLIRVWVQKYEAGALDEDAQAADRLQEYEAKIAALERMVGRQALEKETRAQLARDFKFEITANERKNLTAFCDAIGEKSRDFFCVQAYCEWLKAHASSSSPCPNLALYHLQQGRSFQSG